MKELLRSLPDGANDFGNGVIGPSFLDIQRANASLSFENLRAQETRAKDNGGLILVSSESKLGRFFKEVFRKVPKRFILPAGAVLSLVAAACSGGGGVKNSNSQELENRESGYSLPFPKGETWYLTTGPHGDGLSAIDIAPPEFGRLKGSCPTDGSRLSIDNRLVTASASGEVVLAGKDNDRNDPFHSIVDIKDNNGLTQRYIHLDNTRVKLGNKIKQGEALGNPSCEFPPGGGNTGPHLHIGLMKDGQPIPIDGVVVGGWTIHNGVDGKDGTMTKDGEKTRTASTGRYVKNSTGIRNDLPNTSNKVVVASPKDPIAPISGQVTSKEVFTATPTPTVIPTPKPTETPKPAVEKKISLSKKPEELYRALLTGSLTEDTLPPGVTLKVKSATDPDATAKEFKAVGQVAILVEDTNLVGNFGLPNGGITYIIFPDTAKAEGAYQTIATSSSDGREVKGFPYRAVIFTQSGFVEGFLGKGLVGGASTFVMQYENVVIATITFSSFGLSNDQVDQEKEAITLAKAAIEHLGKVGK